MTTRDRTAARVAALVAALLVGLAIGVAIGSLAFPAADTTTRTVQAFTSVTGSSSNPGGVTSTTP